MDHRIYLRVGQAEVEGQVEAAQEGRVQVLATVGGAHQGGLRGPFQAVHSLQNHRQEPPGRLVHVAAAATTSSGIPTTVPAASAAAAPARPCQRVNFVDEEHGPKSFHGVKDLRENEEDEKTRTDGDSTRICT